MSPLSASKGCGDIEILRCAQNDITTVTLSASKGLRRCRDSSLAQNDISAVRIDCWHVGPLEARRAMLLRHLQGGLLMTGRWGLTVWATLACLLAANSGCMTRKGFIIGGDFKLEFNRVPWRTGPDGQYEVDGPDCLTCKGHGGKPGCGGAPPHGTGEGCPPAPLPGDCGLPPEQAHPHSRFNPLPMHDVLRGAAPMPPPYVPGQGEIIREQELPEAVPAPPAKSPEKPPKDSGEKSTGARKPFELVEGDEQETLDQEHGVTRSETDATPQPVGRAAQGPAEVRSAARGEPTSWMFVKPSGIRRVN
jgi:hypothetical protein